MHTYNVLEPEVVMVTDYDPGLPRSHPPGGIGHWDRHSNHSDPRHSPQTFQNPERN